tara:strand:- start:81 stop:2150 length:2070 start_codon:yes stop_codon:yes gene_type:complete
MVKKRLNLVIRKKPPDKQSDKKSKILIKLKSRVKDNIKKDAKNVNDYQKRLEKFKESKRPDKIVDRKEKSIFDCKVIKSKLNTVCKSKEIVKRLSKIVTTISNMSWATYNFLNLHLLRILQDNKSIPKIDQTLINRVACLISVQNGNFNYPKGIDTELFTTLEKYKSTVSPDYEWPDRKKIGTIQNFMVSEMVVSVKNHLTLNFQSRFSKYLKLKYDISDRCARNYIFKSIFKTRGDYPSKFDKNLKYQILVKKYRIIFKHPKDDTKLSDPSFTLVHYYKMLKLFQEKESTTFSLLPQKSTLIPGHITISTSCLPDILSLWSGKPNINFSVLSVDELWSQLFKIPKRGLNDWFGGMILTNGYDVSVYYKRAPNNFKYSESEWNGISYIDRYKILDGLIVKNHLKINNAVKKEYKISELDSDTHLIGNDGGHRFMFTMTDRDGNLTRCSGKEYRHMTGMKERLRRINIRKDSVEVLKEMCKWSLKCSNVDSYLENLSNQFKIWKQVVKEYNRNFYRKLRFSSRIKKTKTFYELGERIQGRYKKVLIGWGDGGTNQKGLKGHHMPLKEFKKHLLSTRSGISAYEVDEYYTTKKCWVCKSDTVKVMYKKEVEDQDGNISLKHFVNYGLRRCNNNECRILWDRDVNACKNILEVFLCYLRGEERPEYLCRVKKTVEETLGSPGLTKNSRTGLS